MPGNEPAPKKTAEEIAAEATSAHIAEMESLIAWMRKNGVRKFADADLEIELEPAITRPGLPYYVRPKPETREERFKREDSEAEAKADSEQTEEQKARAKHERDWRRITRSSGAPIPPFRGISPVKS